MNGARDELDRSASASSTHPRFLSGKLPSRRGVFADPPTQQFDSSRGGRAPLPEALEESKPVWRGGQTGDAPNRAMVAYCAGRDVSGVEMADYALVPYDVWTNAAHALMLGRQGIVSLETANAIIQALANIESEYQRGKLKLNPSLEDVHINIEAIVAKQAGESVSGMMHVGRSRNDQSATDMRLWLRDALLDFEADLLALVDALARKAAEWKTAVMPGYSHGQPAMISTLGHWAASHAEALLRDIARLRRSFRATDLCPLGSAAGFGTSWNIDRRMTARLLGFSQVLPVALDCVTNRWEAEADAVGSLAFAFNHLSILAQDLILFSSPPRSFLRLPDAYTTGSSIMPQKRNPDFAEVTRAKAAMIQGTMASMMSLARGLGSGYNRDTQWTKYMVMDAFREASFAGPVLAGALDGAKPDRAAMHAACRVGFMNAVEIADYLSRECDLEFRLAYRAMGRAVKASQEEGELSLKAVEREFAAEGRAVSLTDERWRELCDPVAIVNMRRSDGSPAFDKMEKALEEIREQISTARQSQYKRAAGIQRSINTLRKLSRDMNTRLGDASSGEGGNSSLDSDG